MDLTKKSNEVLVDVLTDIISELRTSQDLDRRDALKAAARAIQKELQRRQMLPERKLSKGEEKTREKYVKGMKKSKGDFEKRYGKDAESVMYATATKMAKKKNESIEESLMAEWQQEKQQPLNEIGISTIASYLVKKAAQLAKAKKTGNMTSKKSPEVQAQNRANAEKRLKQHTGENPQIQKGERPAPFDAAKVKDTKVEPTKAGPQSLDDFKKQTTSANDPTFESLMDQWLQEKKDPCWKGYKMIGMKKKGDKDVPNCVPTKGKKKS